MKTNCWEIIISLTQYGQTKIEQSWVSQAKYYHSTVVCYVSHRGRFHGDFIQFTSRTPMRATWVSKEAEMFMEFEFVGILLYFSAKSE